MAFQLTKDEIRIFGPSNTGFYVPIHPTLLERSRSFDRTLANRVFPQAAGEWYEDLQVLLANTPALEPDLREFCNELLRYGKPRVLAVDGRQELEHIGWEDRVRMDRRGFATTFALSPSTNSLYFNEEDRNCKVALSLTGGSETRFNLSREKVKSLACEEHGDFAIVATYAKHNVDTFPGALFLRNWAMAYVNAAMESV